MKKILLSEGEYTVELADGEALCWDASFLRQDDLEVLHIPEGTGELAAYAFRYCGSLKKINMPASVKKLGDKMFYGTYHCIEIYYAGTSEQFKEIAEPRRVKKMVQVTGKYDVQPYCNTEGTYYKEEWQWEYFDNFCAECLVICADGVTLRYGYRKPN